MPALKPVPGVAKVVLTLTAGGSNLQHVMHFAMGVSPRPFTLQEIQSVANNFSSKYRQFFLPVLGTAVTFVRTDAFDLIDETGAEASDLTTAAGGTTGTDTLPLNVAMCITWNIQNRYRGGHPRTYLGGLNQSRLGTLKQWNQTFATAVGTAANDFLEEINFLSIGGQPGRLGHVARYRAKSELPEPFFIAWNSATVDLRVDSQRRRVGKDIP
jgi:hypothetical protein